MQSRRYISYIFIIVLLQGLNQFVSSQQSVSLIPDQSAITIKGTSNLHEWEESVEKFKCQY